MVQRIGICRCDSPLSLSASPRWRLRAELVLRARLRIEPHRLARCRLYCGARRYSSTSARVDYAIETPAKFVLPVVMDLVIDLRKVTSDLRPVGGREAALTDDSEILALIAWIREGNQAHAGKYASLSDQAFGVVSRSSCRANTR